MTKLTPISSYTPCIVHTHFQYDLYFHICFSSWITKMCQYPFSIWPIFLFLVSILNNKRFLMVPIPKDSCPCHTILLLYASSDIWSPFFHVVCGNHHGGPLKKCILELANFLRTFFPFAQTFFFSLPFPLLPHWLILALPCLQLVKDYKISYASTYKPFTMTFRFMWISLYIKFSEILIQFFFLIILETIKLSYF